MTAVPKRIISLLQAQWGKRNVTMDQVLTIIIGVQLAVVTTIAGVAIMMMAYVVK